MKYILFGAGDIGIRALNILGKDNIAYFSDNKKSGTEICDIEVIAFQQMVELKNEYQIIITSEKYTDEMISQLEENDVFNYLVFNRRYKPSMNKYLPKYNYLYNTQYMNYTDILLNYKVSLYKNIVIIGVNEYLADLLLEIAILSDIKNVKGIVGCSNVTDYYGIPSIKINEIQKDIDCIIINERRTDSAIRDNEILEGKHIIDIFDVDKFIFYNQHPELIKYKNIHKGKRAFVVGNGPSVKIEDLKRLHDNDEITFGLNKVYKIFTEIEWRPTYLCMTDTRVISSSEQYIDDLIKETTLFMADRYVNSKVGIRSDINYIHLKSEQFLPNLPGFSDDIVTGTYWGGSVVYDIVLQLAAYMGISEIYLIGIDHNNVGKVTNKANHFIDNYFEEYEEAVYKNVVADFESMTHAYIKANDYAKKNGFKIFNATRGGKLEVFERVEFDCIKWRK